MLVPPARPVPLDDTTQAIVEQLRLDGRRPYASIGRAVGLSEAAVRQRVARLVESGALRITAVTDAALVGRPRAAMLGIRAEGDLGELAGRLAEVDGSCRWSSPPAASTSWPRWPAPTTNTCCGSSTSASGPSRG